MLLYCGTSLVFHIIFAKCPLTQCTNGHDIIVRKNAKLVNLFSHLSFLNKRKSFLDVTVFDVFYTKRNFLLTS